MKEWISNMLASKEGQIAAAVAAVYALNAVLTGLKKGLARIAPKTETQLDDKALAMVSKAATVIDKVIEFMTANSTALPGKAKEEAEAGKQE